MKLGELFVDLDFRDGGALNKLTNFSIKFLALKNAASQAGEVFDGLFGSVIDGVVEMENLNNTTGISIQRMTKWKAIAEQNNVAFGDVIGSLKALQSAQANIMLGKGNAAPFTQLGIDMTRPRDAFNLLNEIRARIGEIKDAGLRRNLLQEMGISENMLILFKNFNGYFDENLQLTAEERKEVLGLNREWIALKQTFGFAWDKVVSQGASGAGEYVKTLREIISTSAQAITASDSLADGIINAWDKVGDVLDQKFKDNYVLRGIATLFGWASQAVYSAGEVVGAGVATIDAGIDRLFGYGVDPARVFAQLNMKRQAAGQPLLPLEYLQTPEGQAAAFREYMGGAQIGGGTRNITTNVTVNTSQPADGNMGRNLGDNINQQIGNAGYING